MQKIQSVTLLILGFFLIVSSFLACNDGFEDYSRNPEDYLAFSTDTLSFDTVLTTVNSPVKAFIVYNPNRKALLISSIGLAGGANSNFKINVDGFSGSTFNDIEIRAKDSIYVLVSTKPLETGQSEPALFDDHVVFITNSVRQTVVLQAYGQDVYKSQGLILDRDTTLSNSKPFLIYDSLVINEGITVEIREGTTFYMGNNAGVIVKGTLKIRGTVEKPVTFRGSRTDYMLEYPYDLIPGQWGGICFDSISYDNELENVHIRNGKFGMDFKTSDPSREKIKMKNVVLTNASGTLINAVNCNMVAENCEFSNSRYHLLNLTGGKYKFTHCTIANYYPNLNNAGWGNTNHETLSLTDTVSTEYYPILGFDVSNSIIAGIMRTSSEISVSVKQEPSEPLNFRNCVFTGNKSDSSYVRYTDCVFEAKADSLFKNVDNDNVRKLIFDFGLSKESPARNVAGFEISSLIPLDIKGINRLEDEYPDAGAYEFVPENETDEE